MRARHKFMENLNFHVGTSTKILFPPKGEQYSPLIKKMPIYG